MVVGEIRRGVDRMRILLSDLVSFAQVVQGDNRNRTNFELDAALDQALQNLAAAVAESGVVVHRKPLPQIWGIESQFVQVFQNLLSNSIKYRRAEEPLVIEIRSADTDLEHRVSISDNGVGFECAYAEQIFSAFKRLHGGDIQGTGIGLTICRRVVEAHGGRIWAESEPGRGATFRFCLPRLPK
jgi:signal transduction histidine kinase